MESQAFAASRADLIGMQTTIERPTIWMPIYWGDYLKETGHLDAIEHGAYLLLLGHYWCSGKPLPNDDTVLARIARLSPAMWRKLRPVIAAFFEIDGTVWRHLQTDKHFELATLRKGKALKAALDRWERRRNEIPEHMLQSCPSSSSSPSEELPPEGVVPPESPRALDGVPRPLGEIVRRLVARKRRDA
jgi:uncharacterized protein YdaU (DUF1376 family)